MVAYLIGTSYHSRLVMSIKKIVVFFKNFGKHFSLCRSIIIDLLIIGLIGLLSISWFRGDYLIAAGDFSMPLDRIKSFNANFYMWDLRSLGDANPRILALTVPVWAYFAFAEAIGLSVVSTEIFLFYFVFTLSGLSMYYLTTTLLSNKAFLFKRLAGLVSGIFYMLNPYVAINIMPLRQTSFMIYAVLPMILAIFVKGLTEKRSLKFAVVASISLMLSTSIFVDPSYVPLTFLPLFIYFSFFILTNLKREAFFSGFKFTTVFISLWALLNLYWLIPDAYSAPNELAQVTGAYGSVGMSFQSNVLKNSAPLLGAVRLLGYWALDTGYKGDPYFTWASTYQSPVLIIISFLLPLLAFVPVLLKSKDKHILFFTSFAIISLLLVNGSYSPIGAWIYTSVPHFETLFNTPYLRFEIYVVLAYAFLIGYALAELFSRFSLHLKKFRKHANKIISGLPVVFMLFLIVGVYAFPLWTGDVVRPGTEVIPSNRYQMPTYYQTATDWLSTDAEDFRIIAFPISKIGYAAFNWENGGYNGPYPAEWLFPKPVISSTLDGNGIAGLTTELIINNSCTAASKLLALMGVKYVLFHEDTNWAYVEDHPSWISSSPEQINSILNSTDAFSLEKKFGNLAFYRNNYWNPNHIYAATDSILTDIALNHTGEIVERNDFEPASSVLILSNQLENTQISSLSLNTVFIRKPELLNSTDSPISNALNTARIIYAIESQPTTIFTPNPGNYLLAIKVEAGYDYGNLLAKIDDQIFTIDANSQEQGPVVTYKYIGPINLTVGYHTISTSGEATSIAIYEGSATPINWTSTFASQSYVARYYPSWQAVVRKDGSESLDALSFYTMDQSSYAFPQDFTSWNAYNSTIIYLTTGDNPLRIDQILTDGNPTSDITGVWWETDWMGMATTHITFPIIIPVNQKAIKQINHKADTATLKTNPPPIENMLLYSLKDGEDFADADNLLSSNQTDTPSITYEEINPTKYVVHVDASTPFFLVFSESYDKDWIATIDGQQIPNEYHFTANGFANGWYINKTGIFVITLEFQPQNLFYAGSAISLTTLVICIVFLSKDKIKIIYRKYIKNK
jgi:hypothetical protein